MRSSFRHRNLIWSSVAFFLLLLGSSRGQISPGQLSEYHADLEGIKNCTRCHELGKEVTDEKCLSCHGAISLRRNDDQGYHASAEVRVSPCHRCHSEHHGRDYELVYWPDGQEKFDHELSGYVLEGRHDSLACRSCHNSRLQAWMGETPRAVIPDRTFLGLEVSCTSCHENEHQWRLPTDCRKCHGFDAWAPAPGFDHQTTVFPLRGKHGDMPCMKCHIQKTAPPLDRPRLVQKRANTDSFTVYVGLEYANCVSCHADVHEGRLGPKCDACHTTEGFQIVEGDYFSHDDTAFPLLGKHVGVQCTACHRDRARTEPVLHGACTDCHRDVHNGQFLQRPDGGGCDGCHSVDGFVPTLFGLAEHQTTRYALTGGHLAVPCRQCHVALSDSEGDTLTRFVFEERSCQACHQDIHDGQVAQWLNENGCEYCHNTESWRSLTFDHAKSRFQLIGKHENTACGKCHDPRRSGDHTVVWIKPLPISCVRCHTDVHGGQFLREERGESEVLCERCHSPESWRALGFDHNRDAGFKLEGAHVSLQCEACHTARMVTKHGTAVRYRPLGTACPDCHAGKTDEERFSPGGPSSGLAPPAPPAPPLRKPVRSPDQSEPISYAHVVS